VEELVNQLIGPPGEEYYRKSQTLSESTKENVPPPKETNLKSLDAKAMELVIRDVSSIELLPEVEIINEGSSIV
jgi:hypothetical protein